MADTTTSPATAPDNETRQALIRAFSAWCGDAVTAEDLTQETLFEAWRSSRAPDDPLDYRRWLFGVARNVLLRWRRHQAKLGSNVLPAPESESGLAIAASEFDLDELMDRHDVVELLDAALGRLPQETRQALLLKYIEDLPQVEIAARLGLHQKALEGKLHRGKRAMHRYLVTDASDQAASLGLIQPGDDWVTTRLRCTGCGLRMLEGRWTEGGDLWLECPACDAWPANGGRSIAVRTLYHRQGVESPLARFSARSFKAAAKAVPRPAVQFSGPEFFSTMPCRRCGATIRPIRQNLEEHGFLVPQFMFRCGRCGFIATWSTLVAATASHPAIARWIDRHRQQVRRLRESLIERDGRDFFAVSWQSLSSGETITALHDVETLVLQGVFLNSQRIDNEGAG